MEEAVDRALHGDCVSIFVPTPGRWTTDDTLLGLPSDVLVLAVNTLLARQEENGLQHSCRVLLSCVVVSGSQVTDLVLATQLKECDATISLPGAANLSSFSISTWKHGAVRQHVTTFVEAMQSIQSAQVFLAEMPADRQQYMHTLLQLNLEFTPSAYLMMVDPAAGAGAHNTSASLRLVGLAGVAEANLRASLEQVSYGQGDEDVCVAAPQGLDEDVWGLLRPLLGASALVLVLEDSSAAAAAHAAQAAAATTQACRESEALLGPSGHQWQAWAAAESQSLAEVRYQQVATKLEAQASVINNLETAKFDLQAEVLRLRALLECHTIGSRLDVNGNVIETDITCTTKGLGPASSRPLDASLDTVLCNGHLSVSSASWAPETPSADGTPPLATKTGGHGGTSSRDSIGDQEAPHTARLQAACDALRSRLASSPLCQAHSISLSSSSTCSTAYASQCSSSGNSYTTANGTPGPVPPPQQQDSPSCNNNSADNKSGDNNSGDNTIDNIDNDNKNSSVSIPTLMLSKAQMMGGSCPREDSTGGASDFISARGSYAELDGAVVAVEVEQESCGPSRDLSCDGSHDGCYWAALMDEATHGRNEAGLACVVPTPSPVVVVVSEELPQLKQHNSCQQPQLKQHSSLCERLPESPEEGAAEERDSPRHQARPLLRAQSATTPHVTGLLARSTSCASLLPSASSPSLSYPTEATTDAASCPVPSASPSTAAQLSDQLRVARAELQATRMQLAMVTERLAASMGREPDVQVEVLQEELELLRAECSAGAVQLSAARLECATLHSQLQRQTFALTQLQAQLAAATQPAPQPEQPTQLLAPSRTAASTHAPPPAGGTRSGGGFRPEATPPLPRSSSLPGAQRPAVGHFAMPTTVSHLRGAPPPKARRMSGGAPPAPGRAAAAKDCKVVGAKEAGKPAWGARARSPAAPRSPVKPPAAPRSPVKPTGGAARALVMGGAAAEGGKAEGAALGARRALKADGFELMSLVCSPRRTEEALVCEAEVQDEPQQAPEAAAAGVVASVHGPTPLTPPPHLPTIRATTTSSSTSPDAGPTSDNDTATASPTAATAAAHVVPSPTAADAEAAAASSTSVHDALVSVSSVQEHALSATIAITVAGSAAAVDVMGSTAADAMGSAAGDAEGSAAGATEVGTVTMMMVVSPVKAGGDALMARMVMMSPRGTAAAGAADGVAALAGEAAVEVVMVRAGSPGMLSEASSDIDAWDVELSLPPALALPAGGAGDGGAVVVPDNIFSRMMMMQ